MTREREALRHAQQSLGEVKAERDRRAEAVEQAEAICREAEASVHRAEAALKKIETEATFDLAEAMGRGRSPSNADFRIDGVQRALDEAMTRHAARQRALDKLKDDLQQAEQAVKKAEALVFANANTIVLAEVAQTCTVARIEMLLVELAAIDHSIQGVARLSTNSSGPGTLVLPTSVKEAVNFLYPIREFIGFMNQLPIGATAGHEQRYQKRFEAWRSMLLDDADAALRDVPLPAIELKPVSDVNWIEKQRQEFEKEIAKAFASGAEKVVSVGGSVAVAR